MLPINGQKNFMHKNRLKYDNKSIKIKKKENENNCN